LETAARRLRKDTAAPPPLQLRGFDEHRSAAGYVEQLDDESLEELNDLLPWGSFTVDMQGRRVGDRTRPGRRDTPQEIPDSRVVLADERLGLAGRHVLEVGCFEGIHTIGLCQRAGRVTAVDARVENVVKTIVRCAFYGHHPDVFLCNLEEWGDDEALRADVIFHVGVLYHLREPVQHLWRLGRLAAHGVLLDTHVSEPDEVTASTVVEGREFRYRRYLENPGRKRVLSGMYDHAKWLLLDDVVDLLGEAGFKSVDVVDSRRESPDRTRVTILAQRA